MAVLDLRHKQVWSSRRSRHGCVEIKDVTGNDIFEVAFLVHRKFVVMAQAFAYEKACACRARIVFPTEKDGHCEPFPT